MPLDTHESAKASGVLSSLNSLSKFSQLALSLDSAAASESLLNIDAYIQPEKRC